MTTRPKFGRMYHHTTYGDGVCVNSEGNDGRCWVEFNGKNQLVCWEDLEMWGGIWARKSDKTKQNILICRPINKNPNIGSKTEKLMIGVSITKEVRKVFGITDDDTLVRTEMVGNRGKKRDLLHLFKSGKKIGESVKNASIGYNQISRTSLSNFCEKFFSGTTMKTRLETSFIKKARWNRAKAFSLDMVTEFQSKALEIITWALSDNPNEEILTIYNPGKGIVSVYSMKKILEQVKCLVNLSEDGNIQIGTGITVQRKGGDGNIPGPKDVLTHPSNGIQVKLKVNPFQEEVRQALITSFQIYEGNQK